MLEVVDVSKEAHKQGGELPYHGPKLVLECTETNTPEAAIRMYDRDPKASTYSPSGVTMMPRWLAWSSTINSPA